jgi:hypothetical protein
MAAFARLATRFASVSKGKFGAIAFLQPSLSTRDVVDGPFYPQGHRSSRRAFRGFADGMCRLVSCGRVGVLSLSEERASWAYYLSAALGPPELGGAFCSGVLRKKEARERGAGLARRALRFVWSSLTDARSSGSSGF